MKVTRSLARSLIVALTLWISTIVCHVHHRPIDYINYNKLRVRKDGDITLSVSPTELNTSGDWVVVSWSGVKDPNAQDWIGVYVLDKSGDALDPKTRAPVKYQYCRVSSSHITDGKGSMRLRLVNMRTPYVIGLLRGGFKNPVLVATSDEIVFKNANERLQIHLSLTNDPTEMIVVWVVKNVTEPQVRWAPKTSSDFRKKMANISTYSASDLCGPPATTVGYLDPGQINKVTIDGLTPGKEYYYQVGDENGWSKSYQFTASPGPSATTTTRIIAYGDMGEAQQDDTLQPDAPQPGAIGTTNHTKDQIDTLDMVLHIGDISYANGYAGVWDEFFDLINPIASRIPYMVCIGNHERDFPNSGSYYTGVDSGGECGVPYNIRLPMPRPARDQDWYYIEYGSVHIVLMSTEHNFTTGSKQYQWIKTHLSHNIDRKKTPWLIFAGHRPMYVDSTNDQGMASDQTVGAALRKHIEPLLKDAGVDLVLWGHHHSYQRTCPVYQEECVDGGPINIVIGMGGQSLSKNVRPDEPNWLKYINYEDYGYSRITTNATTLVFEYVRNDDNKVYDSVVLKKN